MMYQRSLKTAAIVSAFGLISASVAALASVPASAQSTTTTIEFPMTVSTGAKACLPNASGTVIDHSFGDAENLEVVVAGLPPNTGFDFFIIQVPKLAVWGRLVYG